MTIWDKTIRRKKAKTKNTPPPPNNKKKQTKKPKQTRKRKVAKASHKQLKEDSDFKVLGSTLNKV